MNYRKQWYSDVLKMYIFLSCLLFTVFCSEMEFYNMAWMDKIQVIQKGNTVDCLM